MAIDAHRGTGWMMSDSEPSPRAPSLPRSGGKARDPLFRPVLRRPAPDITLSQPSTIAFELDWTTTSTRRIEAWRLDVLGPPVGGMLGLRSNNDHRVWFAVSCAGFISLLLVAMSAVRCARWARLAAPETRDPAPCCGCVR